MIESPKSLTEQLLNLTERIASETRAVYNKIGNPVRTINGEKPDDQGAVVVDAVPPAITVSAVTLAAGATASVEKSGTDKAPVFTFGIPQGEKGDTGPQGEKGEKGDAGPAGTNAYLTATGVGAGSVGPGADVSIALGGKGSILIPYFSVDSYGRVLTKGTRTLTVTTGTSCNNCSDCNNCSECNDHP